MLETTSKLAEKDLNGHIERIEAELTANSEFRIKWHIITSENAEEVFAKLEAEGIDPVLFGLTDKDFQLIAKNFAQIRNQLKVTNELLDKYKEYYEPEKKELDNGKQ